MYSGSSKIPRRFEATYDGFIASLSKMRTTCDYLLNARTLRGFKMDDNCEGHDEDHHDPCSCWLVVLRRDERTRGQK